MVNTHRHSPPTVIKLSSLISCLENKHDLFLTLCCYEIRPMRGEGFHFPVHCWGVSNTTWSKVLMGKQLLYFEDWGTVKHTERGILCPGWSTWWPHAIQKARERTMSTIHTVILSLFFLLNKEYEVSATHRFCPDIVTTLSVDHILLER